MYHMFIIFLFLMRRRPPRSTRTDTRFPYTTLFLSDAVEQHRLVPVAYYGIADGTDYRNLSWRRGRGYDPGELSELVTGDHILARRIIDNTLRTVPNPEAMRALGFCVSVAHARFMADQFNAKGLPAVAVSADTPRDERRQALQALAAGEIRVVFSVDLFNEGIDVPSRSEEHTSELPSLMRI